MVLAFLWGLTILLKISRTWNMTKIVRIMCVPIFNQKRCSVHNDNHIKKFASPRGLRFVFITFTFCLRCASIQEVFPSIIITVGNYSVLNNHNCKNGNFMVNPESFLLNFNCFLIFTSGWVKWFLEVYPYFQLFSQVVLVYSVCHSQSMWFR